MPGKSAVQLQAGWHESGRARSGGGGPAGSVSESAGPSTPIIKCSADPKGPASLRPLESGAVYRVGDSRDPPSQAETLGGGSLRAQSFSQVTFTVLPTQAQFRGLSDSRNRNRRWARGHMPSLLEVSLVQVMKLQAATLLDSCAMNCCVLRV